MIRSWFRRATWGINGYGNRSSKRSFRGPRNWRPGDFEFRMGEIPETPHGNEMHDLTVNKARRNLVDGDEIDVLQSVAL